MITQPEEKTAEETTIGVGCEEDVWAGTQPHIIIETKDNAADIFVHTFVSTLHKWIVGGIVLLMLSAFVTFMGVV
jgi:hypothetical protein